MGTRDEKSYAERLLEQHEQPKSESIDVGKIERELEELRRAYDQYFLGQLKVQPAKLHERMKTQIRSLSQANTKTTQTNFKVQSLIARYNSLNHLWGRTLLEIEAGRHPREKLKKSESAVTQAQATPPSKSPDASGLDLRHLYSEYSAALKSASGSSKVPSLKQFEAQMAAQKEQFMKKFGHGNMKVAVIAQDGKVRLKISAIKK